MELWRLKFMSLFFAAAFMLVVAIRLNIDQMYLMAGILVSIPLVSYIIGSYALKDVSLRRSGPETGFEGDAVQVELIITNANELMRDLLSAQDVTPEGLSVEEVKPDPTRPGHLVERLVASRRGQYQLKSVELTASDPLGLFLFRRPLPLASEFLVYPLPMELPEAFLGREARSGREIRSTLSRRGESLEMHSTREYQYGDELRHIHWPSTARTGRLVVVERAEPTDRTTWIALDLTHGSERGQPPYTTLDTAARLAAAAAREALAEGEAVAMILPDQEPAFLAANRGTDHYYTLLQGLAKAKATATMPLGEALIHHATEASARLLFFTSAPDAFLLQGLAVWLQHGGSATGILLDAPLSSGAQETMTLEAFAGEAEHMGVGIHRFALDSFSALSRTSGGSLVLEERA